MCPKKAAAPESSRDSLGSRKARVHPPLPSRIHRAQSVEPIDPDPWVDPVDTA